METIAAIATPLGEGGIGIIRISGDYSSAIMRRVFRPVKPRDRFEPRKLYLGHVINGRGECLDQVLAVRMRGPATYTGEDVVEIHTHGGAVVTREVLRIILEAGARLAEPGEFTQRAFLAGKIDLVQAEAVIDLIRAASGAAAKQAERHLDGELSSKIRLFREQILALLAQVAASVDFPEHDIPDLASDKISVRLGSLLDEMKRLLDTGLAGKMLREGVQVVIAGRPNVGKSSLLNMLVGHEKAIVTPCAGTTRDLVEEYINIAGLPVRLVDTAGVHAAQDPVEQIGVERARSAIAGADLILMVIDLSSGLGAADQAILEQVAALPHLLVGNKADLKVVEHGIDELSEPLISVSAQTGQGIELLREAIAERLMGRRVLEDSVLLANARQEQALQRALQGVSDALVGAQSGVAVDLLAVDLQFAYDSLGLLLGETVDEDIIEQVFSRFCIGK